MASVKQLTIYCRVVYLFVIFKPIERTIAKQKNMLERKAKRELVSEKERKKRGKERKKERSLFFAEV